jgi:hypothetical protein
MATIGVAAAARAVAPRVRLDAASGRVGLALEAGATGVVGHVAGRSDVWKANLASTWRAHLVRYGLAAEPFAAAKLTFDTLSVTPRIGRIGCSVRVRGAPIVASAADNGERGDDARRAREKPPPLHGVHSVHTLGALATTQEEKPSPGVGLPM